MDLVEINYCEGQKLEEMREQKRIEDTGPKLICDDDCPVRRTASLIDGKWTTLIIRDLLSGTKRFSELQNSLTGISPKILSARMSFLVENGLVEKTIYPCVPPKTEYTLTPVGARLEKVILAMMEFGQTLPKNTIAEFNET